MQFANADVVSSSSGANLEPSVNKESSRSGANLQTAPQKHSDTSCANAQATPDKDSETSGTKLQPHTQKESYSQLLRKRVPPPAQNTVKSSYTKCHQYGGCIQRYVTQ